VQNLIKILDLALKFYENNDLRKQNSNHLTAHLNKSARKWTGGKRWESK